MNANHWHGVWSEVIRKPRVFKFDKEILAHGQTSQQLPVFICLAPLPALFINIFSDSRLASYMHPRKMLNRATSEFSSILLSVSVRARNEIYVVSKRKSYKEQYSYQIRNISNLMILRRVARIISLMSRRIRALNGTEVTGECERPQFSCDF